MKSEPEYEGGSRRHAPDSITERKPFDWNGAMIRAGIITVLGALGYLFFGIILPHHDKLQAAHDAQYTRSIPIGVGSSIGFDSDKEGAPLMTFKKIKLEGKTYVVNSRGGMIEVPR